MTPDQAVFDRLSTAAGVVALVSTRVYPIMLPQAFTDAAVLYLQMESEPVHTFGSSTLIHDTRFLIESVADTHDGALAVAGAVRAALDGQAWDATGGIPCNAWLQNENDSQYEPESDMFVRQQTYRVVLNDPL